MPEVATLHFTGDADADRLLAEEPLALLVGMLLDQQIPMERAFRSPYELRRRLGGRLDAAAVAAGDPDELSAVFSEKPALHRFPGSMATRVHALCEALVEHYGGRAEAVWEDAASGDELLARLEALPGFGREKARIFVAVLGRRLGVGPPGWEAVAADWPCIADVDGPGALERVREEKAAWKAAKAESKAKGKGKSK